MSCFIKIFMVVLVIFTTACDSSRLISGVYRSEDKVIIEGVEGFTEGVWVELVLGQFGPDLTGLVKVYPNDQFLGSLEGMCGCRFIDEGTVIGSDVSFIFRSNGNCSDSENAPLLLAAMTFDDPGPVIDQTSGQYLSGTIVLEGSDAGNAPTLTFRRVLGINELGASDLVCDDPLVRGIQAAAVVSGLTIDGGLPE
jgi:hypothetical protein